MGFHSGAGGAGEEDGGQDWGVSAHLRAPVPSKHSGSGLRRAAQERARGWTTVWETPLPGADLQLFGMQITTASYFPLGKEAEDSSKNTSQQDCY